MASALLVLAILAIIDCTILRVKGNPADDFVIHINHYMLYEMVKDRSDITDSTEQATSILETLCNQNGVLQEHLDTPRIANNLRKSIGQIMTKAKKAIRRGGKQGKIMMEKMKAATYNLRLGGYKRKLEHKLESERKKRRVAEEENRERKKLVSTFRRKARDSYVALGRILKTRMTTKRNVPRKYSYSKTWRKVRKHQMRNVMDGVNTYLHSEGIELQMAKFKDQSGIAVQIGGIDESSFTIAVQRALYKKDKNGTADRAYQDYAMEKGSGYPSLQKELNSLFRVQHLPNNEGVFESLEEKVIRVLENIPDLQTDQVRIKISGDGTCMGNQFL